jgi:hypothetical protein
MECYICYDKEKQNDKFCSNSICKCRGTNKIHISCFEKLKREYGNTCTICKSKFKENIVVREPIHYQQRTNPEHFLVGNKEDSYEYLQELLILEEHFENKKRSKVIQQSNKNDCCMIS